MPTIESSTPIHPSPIHTYIHTSIHAWVTLHNYIGTSSFLPSGLSPVAPEPGHSLPRLASEGRGLGVLSENGYPQEISTSLSLSLSLSLSAICFLDVVPEKLQQRHMLALALALCVGRFTTAGGQQATRDCRGSQLPVPKVPESVLIQGHDSR